VEELYHFTLIEIVAFAMILLRMTSFIFAWPIFGTNVVPLSVKILLALSLTFILYPLVGFKKLPTDPGLDVLVTIAVREITLGLVIGFMARLFFFGIGIAGQVMSISIGLTTAQLFNPALNEQSAALDQFYLILATLLFLGIQGHQMLLTALAKSYEFVPLSTTWYSIQAFGSMGHIAQEIMLMGIKLSAPVLVAILFLNVAMAVIGRAVPQMNVLITSLPVNILVGIVVLFVTLPVMVWQMDSLAQETIGELFQMIRSF
jgi:flagellar biosynthetic protein FliR